LFYVLLTEFVFFALDCLLHAGVDPVGYAVTETDGKTDYVDVVPSVCEV
jgi:hypothetical protein